MTFSSNPATSKPIVLVPILREEAPTLHNLYELYAHDFSEFVPLPIKASGRFEVTPGDLWWNNATHHAFFMRRGDFLCGFALVRRGSRISEDSDVMDMAEFFVLRGERRRNVGVRAANALLSTFPGRWEIRVRQANAPAIAFWSRVVAACAGRVEPRSFTQDGVDWFVFAFSSLARSNSKVSLGPVSVGTA